MEHDLIVQAIWDKLKSEERSLLWLSNKCGFKYNSFYCIMKQGTMRLNKAYLDKINEVLDTDFELKEAA